MEAEESKIASLVYEVCFGAIFKLKHEGKRVVAVSKRDKDNGRWLDAHEIEDHAKVYTDLGDDQFAIVVVESKGDVVRLREMFRAALLGDGDTGTIAQAVRQKKLGQILEQAFSDWQKASGPILQLNGEKTYIWPDELVARYDSKDLPALRLAYEHELREGSTAEQNEHITKAVERFNAFIDKVQPEDEVYWFEHKAMLADRIGYCIMREGRVVAAHIVLMS
jgi:hypothetical protein